MQPPVDTARYTVKHHHPSIDCPRETWSPSTPLQAWEVKLQPPARYWSNVPDDVLPRLHFYNVPVSGQEDLASNPLNIIRNKYRPGDYVVSQRTCHLALGRAGSPCRQAAPSEGLAWHMTASCWLCSAIPAL